MVSLKKRAKAPYYLSYGQYQTDMTGLVKDPPQQQLVLHFQRQGP